MVLDSGSNFKELTSILSLLGKKRRISPGSEKGPRRPKRAWSSRWLGLASAASACTSVLTYPFSQETVSSPPAWAQALSTPPGNCLFTPREGPTTTANYYLLAWNTIGAKYLLKESLNRSSLLSWIPLKLLTFLDQTFLCKPSVVNRPFCDDRNIALSSTVTTSYRKLLSI